MIIDVHNHLPVNGPERSYEQARDQFVADMARDGVDYAILIPDNVPESNIGDVDTCLRLVEGRSNVFLLGTVNLDDQGPEWLSYLDSLLQARRIVGMKIFPGFDPIYPTDQRLDPYYALCTEHEAPMMIHTGINPGHPEVAMYNDPKYIVEVAQRFPDLKIVIAHYFWPEVDYCYDITRGHANVYFDTSGLADPELVELTGAEAIERVVLASLAHYPRSIIFGTDHAMCDRQQHLEWVNALPISTDTKEDILWRNAAHIFNLQIG